MLSNLAFACLEVLVPKNYVCSGLPGHMGDTEILCTEKRMMDYDLLIIYILASEELISL